MLSKAVGFRGWDRWEPIHMAAAFLYYVTILTLLTKVNLFIPHFLFDLLDRISLGSSAAATANGESKRIERYVLMLCIIH